MLSTIQALCSERVPRRFGFDRMRDIQVLTPMHKGICGSENLNRELQTALNPSGPSVNGLAARIGWAIA